MLLLDGQIENHGIFGATWTRDKDKGEITFAISE